MTEPSDDPTGALEGRLLWAPSEETKARSALGRYMGWLEREHNLRFASYAELYAWSVRSIPEFWESIWQYFEVKAHSPYTRVLGDRTMPGARWFEGATLNYAEHALRRTGDDLAVIALDESSHRTTLTFKEISEKVARARAGLRRLGVARGDRVAALVPNGEAALVVFLASASLGAIWSSASPEFGVKSVLDRFSQIAPKVLLTVDGYRYGGKTFDRRDSVREIMAGLPSLEHAVIVSALGEGTGAGDQGASGAGAATLTYDELLSSFEPLEFDPVPFDHPLWVLYSSGTTGLPKPIVQGHGGILLEHLKALSLHCDLGPGDRFFWFSTTGWMMWNFLVSGLTVGATLVLYDGSPGHPDLAHLFRVAEREKVTYFGTSAPYLLACKKAGIVPQSEADLSALRAIGTTGAPLPADGFAWVYENIKSDLLLGSVSGGTDVCTAFVLSCPLLPVHAGEIQCRGLGAAIAAFDEAGRPLIGEVGELVMTEPFPSMPIYFWGDLDGHRYRESYFETYPGIWRHGDWIKITEGGSCLIYGRSDSTLNRGGVRMGTSEFYRVVEAIPEIADSVVIDTGSLDQTDGKLLLFVVLRPGAALDDSLRQSIKSRIRVELSPRHVPDEICVIGEVPRTLNGKKLEVPLKKILSGVAVEKAVSRGTLANPAALEEFAKMAVGRG